jgi:hypothetical protein
MERFEFQLAMLQKGAEELEKKIANFTTILMQLKTAAVTIWVALIGWVFASKINALVPLGYVIIFGFWFLEATYWRVQFYLFEGVWGSYKTHAVPVPRSALGYMDFPS